MVAHRINTPAGVFDLPDKFFSDILDTALAGGISYWAHTVSYQDNENPGLNRAVIEEFEEENPEPHTLDVQVVAEGVRRMLAMVPTHPNSRSNLVATYAQIYDWLLSAVREPEDAGAYIDADVADSVIQFALFEELVYG